MSVAYADTLVLKAIVFDGPGTAVYSRHLDKFFRVMSSNWLEVELRAAFARENLGFQETAMAGIDWILPNRTLAPEFAVILQAGYLRGTDPWHVATAPCVSLRSGGLSFATLVARKNDVAAALGHVIPWDRDLP